MLNSLILVVDDEPDLVNTLEYNLEREGYRVRSALDGKGALAALTQRPIPDMVLLDLMLPDMSGKEICQRIRANPDTEGMAVIMLTAKSEEMDRVIGFEVGADDYVTKPFSTRELLLRIRAVLRRNQTKDEGTDVMQLGALRVDPAAHEVWLDDEEVILTSLEFRLLTTLLSRKGRVQTREALLSDVWGIDAEVATRTVDTHVKRLRKKLGTFGDRIETLRGVGYRIRSDR